MPKIPISGGPHTGKTTLLEALRLEFPDAYFVPEPAERVIARELAKEAIDPNYAPIVPWRDYSSFGPAVADESTKLEAAIPKKASLIFLDRSLIDTIGYCRLNGFESFIPEVIRRVRAARYAFSLFCEPVGSYTTTEVRRESAEAAMITHDYLAQAYDESGIKVVHLPSVPVEERVVLVRKAIEAFGSNDD